MRTKTIKTDLQSVYQPPAPRGKETFFEQIQRFSTEIDPGQITMPQFLVIQFRYIRPWGYLLSVIVFLVALLAMHLLGREAGWQIASLIPMVSASMIVELHRSVHYKMDELEQATRFSLKAVTFARLCILGIGNLILLILLTPFIVWKCQVSLIESVVFLLCPYALTAFLCLMVIRHWHSKENVYACAGISVGVSLLCIVSNQLIQLTINTLSGVGITLVLLVLMTAEYRKYLNGMEELSWN